MYCDEAGRDHDAVLTAVWGPMTYPYDAGKGEGPTVNIVHVEDDANRNDQYGRQIARPTSVTHATRTHAPGRYWRLPTEARVTAAT